MNSVIKQSHICEFCSRSFVKESTLYKHTCEKKRRWLNKDLPSSRIGFHCWLKFYISNTTTAQKKTYSDFMKSSYYLTFIRFSSYCIDVKVINIMRYADWLVKNQIPIDKWTSDTNYTRFIIEYSKDENALDAIARSIETTIDLAKNENLATNDCLRYGSRNRICYAITAGKISPWMLYQSKSGIAFIESLDETQIKMILDYIQPEQWAIKFKRNQEMVGQITNLLTDAGY